MARQIASIEFLNGNARAIEAKRIACERAMAVFQNINFENFAILAGQGEDAIRMVFELA